MPARQMVGHLLKQPVIEVSKNIAAEFAASLSEGLFTDAPAQSVLAGERGEELIEFGLHAHAQIAEHESDQGGQGELAMTGESGGTFRMAGMVLKDLGMQ
ncbi:hypothetical protein, partial [Cupriavidus sp. 8B]